MQKSHAMVQWFEADPQESWTMFFQWVFRLCSISWSSWLIQVSIFRSHSQPKTFKTFCICVPNENDIQTTNKRAQQQWKTSMSVGVKRNMDHRMKKSRLLPEDWRAWFPIITWTMILRDRLYFWTVTPLVRYKTPRTTSNSIELTHFTFGIQWIKMERTLSPEIEAELELAAKMKNNAKLNYTSM